MKTLFKRGESASQIIKALTDSIGRNVPVHTLIGEIDASDQKRIFVAPCECIVRDVWLVTESGAAIDATNYHSFQVKNVTKTKDLMAAAVSYFTGGTAITADTPYKLTPDQNNKLAEGDVIELDVTKAASPTALAECSVIVFVSFDADDEA